MIAGVDGCKGGWVAAIGRETGDTEVVQFRTFSELIGRAELLLIVIDVPIGLLSKGARQCDLAARELLGQPRGSSVFPAPIRPVLPANCWEEACRIRFEAEGKRCTKQTAAILSKVREVDAVMTPVLQRLVYEGHPELSFAAMNCNVPIISKKSSPKGEHERRELLSRYFPDVERQLSGCRRSEALDVIDAYACLWTARRVSQGEEVRLRPDPEVDEKGLRAQIVA